MAFCCLRTYLICFILDLHQWVSDCGGPSRRNHAAALHRPLHNNLVHSSSWIRVMFTTDKSAACCEGFQSGSSEMTFSISTIFFLTKHVDVFGSGMYFYGFNADVYPGFRMIHLNIKGKKNSKFLLIRCLCFKC